MAGEKYICATKMQKRTEQDLFGSNINIGIGDKGDGKRGYQ